MFILNTVYCPNCDKEHVLFEKESGAERERDIECGRKSEATKK